MYCDERKTKPLGLHCPNAESILSERNRECVERAVFVPFFFFSFIFFDFDFF